MKNKIYYTYFVHLHDAADYDMATFGTGGVGVAMAKRYFSDDPWAHPKDLAQDLPLSAAQIRRRLDGLVEEGKVHRSSRDGKTFYSLSSACAEEYVKMLDEKLEHIIALQNATPVAPKESAN